MKTLFIRCLTLGLAAALTLTTAAATAETREDRLWRQCH